MSSSYALWRGVTSRASYAGWESDVFLVKSRGASQRLFRRNQRVAPYGAPGRHIDVWINVRRMNGRPRGDDAPGAGMITPLSGVTSARR